MRYLIICCLLIASCGTFQAVNESKWNTEDFWYLGKGPVTAVNNVIDYEPYNDEHSYPVRLFDVPLSVVGDFGVIASAGYAVGLLVIGSPIIVLDLVCPK